MNCCYIKTNSLYRLQLKISPRCCGLREQHSSSSIVELLAGSELTTQSAIYWAGVRRNKAEFICSFILRYRPRQIMAEMPFTLLRLEPVIRFWKHYFKVKNVTYRIALICAHNHSFCPLSVLHVYILRASFVTVLTLL